MSERNSNRDQRKHDVLSHGQSAMVKNIDQAVIIKDDEIFFVCGPDGSIPVQMGHGFGLYYHDTRYLNGYELRLNGEAPTPLAAVADEGFLAKIQLTNPQLEENEDTIAKRKVGVSWQRLLSGENLALYDTIELHNYGHKNVTIRVSLSFQAAFEDVYAVRGLLPEHPGKLHEPRWNDGTLEFFYEGVDGWNRSTTIRSSREPDEIGDVTATFEIAIEPGESSKIELSVCVAERKKGEQRPKARRPPSLKEVARIRREVAEDWIEIPARVQSDNPLLDRVLSQSMRDLQLLRTPLDGEEYFAAGLPWFGTLFGRDSLIAAIQMLAFHPQIAEKVLRLLASRQGSKEDSWRDEQPGRILHEYRMGELARAGRLPHSPYYGTIDAPLLFLILTGMHASWTGDLSVFEELQDNVEAILSWIDNYGDANGDGYIDYDSESDHGLLNQGWKDSGDGIVNAEGEIAEPPISLVEVQGYLYRAWTTTASLFRRVGNSGKADELERRAAELRARFNNDFWLDDIGIYAMALEKGGRPLEVVSSNCGHALWAGIADDDKAQRTALRLFQDDSFSGWGVRTLAASEKGYDPVGYHLGAVWPHDNSILVGGLKHHLRDEEALRIFQGMLDAAESFEHFRLPEAFSGFSREEYSTPVRYPVACHPQAWASGAMPYMLQQVLGLEADAFEKRLRIVRPCLPGHIRELQLCGVHVGGASVDLHFKGGKEGATVEARAYGELEVDVVTN
ncbi:MAG: glycogen debranching N-terminal domain-containing protein [Bryobacterales bacterium]